MLVGGVDLLLRDLIRFQQVIQDRVRVARHVSGDVEAALHKELYGVGLKRL